MLTDSVETDADRLTAYLSRIVKHGQEQSISISRKSTTILADLIKLHKRGLDIQLKPDVEFLGEDGVDASGPTREFFQQWKHWRLVTGVFPCLKEKGIIFYLYIR